MYLLKQLNGTLHLIRGNHDTDERIKQYVKCHNVWEMVVPCADVIKYNGYQFYLSHYPTLCENHNEHKPLKNQVINLCGHLHTKNRFEDIDKGLIYHCELDVHNITPVCIDDIIDDIVNYTQKGKR